MITVGLDPGVRTATESSFAVADPSRIELWGPKSQIQLFENLAPKVNPMIGAFQHDFDSKNPVDD